MKNKLLPIKLLPENAKRTDFSKANKKILIFECANASCSNEIKVQPSRIRIYTGYCTSCLMKKQPFGVLYKRLLANCKLKNISNSITYAQMVEFTKQKNCIYCNSKIDWVEFTTSQRGAGAYNLDRKDCTIGYSKENCVVCCKICNWSKNDLFSHEEFLVIGRAIKKVLKNRK